MINQICRVQKVSDSTVKGSVLQFIDKKRMRMAGIIVTAAVLWDDQTMSTEDLADIVGIPGENNYDDTIDGTGLCRGSKDGVNGVILQFVENRQIKPTDPEASVIVLTDDRILAVMDFTGMAGIASENAPDEGTRVGGSGSGLTAVWSALGGHKYSRTSGGVCRISSDSGSFFSNAESWIYLEKVNGDESFSMHLDNYELISSSITVDGRYVKYYLNQGSGSSADHVFMLKNMIDGVSMTLYKMLSGGGLEVIEDFGIALDTELV